jgi:hypothetical protein
LLRWACCGFSQVAASNASGTELNLPLSDTRTARTRRSRSFRGPTHVRSRPTVLGLQYRHLCCCLWRLQTGVRPVTVQTVITRQLRKRNTNLTPRTSACNSGVSLLDLDSSVFACGGWGRRRRRTTLLSLGSGGGPLSSRSASVCRG